MTKLGRLGDWSLLILCNLIWASQFVLVKLVQEQLGPIAATSLPMAAATLLLVPIVARSEGGRLFPRKDWGGFLLIGVFGQVAAQLLITWGVRYSLASNAALLMLALPVSTAVMAYFLLGEQMSGMRWLSFVLAIAGLVWCSGVDWSQLDLAGRRYLWGNLMIFGSVNGSAFYNVYSKKLLTRHSPLRVLLCSYVVVSACLLPITAVSEPGALREVPHFTVQTWIGLLLLAGAVYLLSMVMFLHVLQRLDAIQTGLCNYLIPFFGLLIAALVLHERLTFPMIAGGALVLASTLLMTLYEARTQ